MHGKRGRPSRVAEPRHPFRKPTLYLESSAVLAAVMEGDVAAAAAIAGNETAASALTFAEVRRTIVRAVLAGRITSAEHDVVQQEVLRIEADCLVLDISDTILARVGRRFPCEPVRTLDAIHLASAELLDDPTAPITLLTRDPRVRENAALLGLQVA